MDRIASEWVVVTPRFHFHFPMDRTHEAHSDTHPVTLVAWETGRRRFQVSSGWWPVNEAGRDQRAEVGQRVLGLGGWEMGVQGMRLPSS